MRMREKIHDYGSRMYILCCLEDDLEGLQETFAEDTVCLYLIDYSSRSTTYGQACQSEQFLYDV